MLPSLFWISPENFPEFYTILSPFLDRFNQIIREKMKNNVLLFERN